MHIGAHVGVGRGWVAAAEYCAEVGAECMQVFSKSPRTWRVSPLPDEVHDAFPEALERLELGPVFVHTSYLINLGTDDQALLARSVDALADEFDRAATVGASGLVTHLGTDPLDDRPAAAERIADAVALARERSSEPGRTVRLLLENSAGSGRHFGGDVTEVGALLCAIEERSAGPVGVCLDSCHAFAFGYDLRDLSGWEGMLDALERACGASRVELVHANDAMFGLAEKRDRHAWIGDGELGTGCFRALMECERLCETPIVTEMPGERPEKDAINTERLVSMRTDAGLAPRATLRGLD
jgi:deoxyribonuclease-4